MASKYLDDAGLAYLWNKIKGWVNSSNANVVHRTGNETIEGVKIFKNGYTSPDDSSFDVSAIYLRNKNCTRGVTESGKFISQVIFGDANGPLDDNTQPDYGRLGGVESEFNFTSGVSFTQLINYKCIDNSGDFSFLRVGYDATNQENYAQCPATSLLRTSGLDILTRNWIPKDTRIVHTTGDEEINGLKVFDNTLILKIDTATKGTSPAATQYKSILITDSTSSVSSYGNDKRFSQIRATVSSTGASLLEFFAFKNEAGSSDSTRISVGYDSNGNAYAIAPSTSSSRSNGGDIVTRDWIPSDTRIVHTTGNETINGEKTFSDTTTISRSNPILQLINTGTSDTYCDIRLCSTGGITTTGLRDSYQGNFTISHSCQGGSWISGASLDFYYSDGSFSLSARSGADATRVNLIGTGAGTLKWNGQTIQTTSDERLKTTLSEVPDPVLDAWEEVNWGQFQYLDAVASKGESARLHLGLIAQHVISVFEKHGLDACDYGILCHDEHPAIDEEYTVVDAEAYVDEEGVEHPAVTHVETRHEDAVDLWMVRYAEAQAMEACCMRRENARLKKHIADLEERLEALELLMKS